jgi:hypothetical protein
MVSQLLAELVVQPRSIGATPIAVQSEHVQLDHPLPGRVFGAQASQLGKHVMVAPQLQTGSKRFLDRVETKFLEIGAQPLTQPIASRVV